MEIIEKNKKRLLAEYQRGYLEGSIEQEKRVLIDFLKDLKYYMKYPPLIPLLEKLEERLKYLEKCN